MSQKQCLKAVYSTKERALLASLVEMYKDKLESKKTDSTTNNINNEAWKMISEQYNTHDVTVRTAGQLKKCWENMKYKTRKADTQVRHNMLLTGGGPPEKDTSDVVDDMVRAIVPTINYTINNSWDSTGIVELGQIVAQDPQPSTSAVVEEREVSCVEREFSEKVPMQVHEENSQLCTEHELNTKKEMTQAPARKILLKRKRVRPVSVLDDEKELRLKKLRESIEQQREVHKLRMEATEAEKQYWIQKTNLLFTK